MMICQHCQSQNPSGTVMCNQCMMPLPLAAPVASHTAGSAVAAPAPLGSPAAPQQLAAASGPPRLRWIQIENLQPTGDSLLLPDLDYEGEILVGRHDLANQIIVDLDLTPLGGLDKKVSRKHARLIFSQNQVYLEDWESHFGTYLNKEKMEKGQRKPLKSGDEIRLAELAFKMEVL